MRILIIGAGIGGMTAAALLAAQEHDVHVFEKNQLPGGKMSEFRTQGYRFDTGPSLLTMPFVLEDVFERCGKHRADYLQLQPVEPICRYFWQDGTEFNCWSDPQKTSDEIRLIAPDDVHAYRPFLQYSEEIYQRTEAAFLYNPLARIRDFLGLNFLDLTKIDALTTVSKRVDSKFKSTYLRQFFKRFTTYNGSSPYLAPATLNVIPHVELTMGGFYVDGGLFELAKALQQLAKDCGATFHYGEEVQRIRTQNDKAVGLLLKNGQNWDADLIVSNADATETYLSLLPESTVSKRNRKKIAQTEPSCSGFVLLLGVNKQYEQLAHHTIFFSQDYEEEFRDIFDRKIMPADPTIYIANTSASNPEHAPKGHSNLFVLVNAPYLDEHQHWDKTAGSYADKIIYELEKRGLTDLSSSVQLREIITPNEFYERFRSNKGSIYGTSSNSRFAAFARPRNKSPYLENLYLTGGSTHPGGGIPLCMLSAIHAVSLISER